MRRTKMVCTIGPSSSAPGVLRELIAAGMDVARLNFSHGAHDFHRETCQAIRSLSVEAGRNVAVMADLQGPKIRTGTFPRGAFVLPAEGEIDLVEAAQAAGARDVIPVQYEGLAEDVVPGDAILIDDGRVALRVLGIKPRLDRIAGQRHLGLRERQRLAGNSRRSERQQQAKARQRFSAT